VNNRAHRTHRGQRGMSSRWRRRCGGRFAVGRSRVTADEQRAVRKIGQPHRGRDPDGTSWSRGSCEGEDGPGNHRARTLRAEGGRSMTGSRRAVHLRPSAGGQPQAREPRPRDGGAWPTRAALHHASPRSSTLYSTFCETPRPHSAGPPRSPATQRCVRPGFGFVSRGIAAGKAGQERLVARRELR